MIHRDPIAPACVSKNLPLKGSSGVLRDHALFNSRLAPMFPMCFHRAHACTPGPVLNHDNESMWGDVLSWVVLQLHLVRASLHAAVPSGGGEQIPPALHADRRHSGRLLLRLQRVASHAETHGPRGRLGALLTAMEGGVLVVPQNSAKTVQFRADVCMGVVLLSLHTPPQVRARISVAVIAHRSWSPHLTKP